MGERKAVARDRFQAGESCGEPGSIDPETGENGHRGANWRNARPSRLPVLGAVHAGDGQGWESGHLEPFPFGDRS